MRVNKTHILLFVFMLMNLSMKPMRSESTSSGVEAKNHFNDGEKLSYALKFGPIHGGNAYLDLNVTDYNNKKVYHAVATAKSVGVTDRLFKVKDIYESYFDMNTCLPYKAIRNISEGDYKFYNEVYYDHANETLYSQKSGSYRIPPDILDMVSSYYYLRIQKLSRLKEGDVMDITTFFGDEIFPFPLRYRGIETVKGPLGKVKCYRFDPVVEVGRIFESEDDMTIWITADKNKIPYKVRFDMIVGAVYCNLVKHENLKYDLETY